MLTTSSTTEETFLNKKRSKSNEKIQNMKIDEEARKLREITEILIYFLRNKKNCTVLEFTKFAYSLSEKKKNKEQIKNNKTYEKEMILDVIKVLVYCGTIEFSEKNYSLYINEKVKTLIDHIDTNNQISDNSKIITKNKVNKPNKSLNKSLMKLLKLYMDIHFIKKLSNLNLNESTRALSKEKITFPFAIINEDVNNITIKYVNENKRIIFLSENQMKFIKPKDIVFNIGIRDIYCKIKENEKSNEQNEKNDKKNDNNDNNENNDSIDEDNILKYLLSFPVVKKYIIEEYNKLPISKMEEKVVTEDTNKSEDKSINMSPKIGPEIIENTNIGSSLNNMDEVNSCYNFPLNFKEEKNIYDLVDNYKANIYENVNMEDNENIEENDFSL